MNDTFTELMNAAFNSAELAAIEDAADYAAFESDVDKAMRFLSRAADQASEAFDIYVVGAALERLSNEYDYMCGDDDA